MQSVQNYFGEFLLWDIFIQGIISMISIILGLSLLIFTLSGEYNNYPIGEKKNIENEEQNEKDENDMPIEKPEGEVLKRDNIFVFITEEFPGLLELLRLDTKQQTVQILSSIVIAASITYSVGIFMSNISERFMNSPESSHLYLKRLWVDPDSEDLANAFLKDTSYYADLRNTSNYFKIVTFNKVFHVNQSDMISDNSDIICKKAFEDKDGIMRSEIYYHAKFKILGNSTWKSYINYSQNLINISQVLTFSMFILLVISMANFFLYILRQWKYSIEIKKKLDQSEETSGNNLKNNEKTPENALKIIKRRIALFWVVCIVTAISQLILYFCGIKHPFMYAVIIFLATYIFLWIVSWILGVEDTYYGLRTKSTIVLSSFALLTYFVAAHSWMKNEREICSKIYGVFKQMITSPIILEHEKTDFLISSYKPKATKLDSAFTIEIKDINIRPK